MQTDVDSRRVPLERTRDVPVARERLLLSLQERLEGADQERFAAVARGLEQRLHSDYLRPLQALKRDFELLGDPGSRSQLRQMSQEQIEEVEDRFLRGFVDTMRQDGYRMLSQDDVEVARCETYLLDLPLRLDWNQLDAELLGRFWEHNDYVAVGPPPEFADRLLVFCRGVGVDRTAGTHFWQKLKLLALRAFSGVYRRAGEKLAGMGGKQPILPLPAASKPPSAYSPPPDDPIVPQPASPDDSAAAAPLVAPTDDLLPPAPAVDSAPAATGQPQPPQKYVERIRLQDQPLSLASLRKETVIQEPTYEDLVILYRQATPAGVRQEVTDKDRTIHVKAFRNVPMADLEAVFADAEVGRGPNVRTRTRTYVFAILLALGIVFPFLMPLAALAMIALAISSIATYTQWVRLLDKLRVHNRRNDDQGVLLSLIDELEERQFKSAVLAYFFVWRQSISSPDELKPQCEALLEQEFGVDVDFDAAGVVKALVERGLLARDDDRLSAVDPQEAARRLAASH